MKIDWRKALAVLILVIGATLLFAAQIRPLPIISATWTDQTNTGAVQFLYPRKSGGVVVTGNSSQMRWLDADGKLVAQINISPDSFFFPEANASRICSGSKQGYVYAMDRESGNLLWKTHAHSRSCSVTFDDKGLIYSIGAQKNGQQPVTVLSQAGVVLRRYNLEGMLAGWPAPLVTESGVLIGNNTKHTSSYSDANLSAYDSAGKKIWDNRLTGFSIMEVLPGSHNDVICVAHQNRVYSVDIKSGLTNWEFVNPHSPHDGFYEIYKLPADRIFVTNSNYAFCLDANGRVIWSHGFPGGVGGTAIGPDGTSYLSVYSTTVPRRVLDWWSNYQINRGNFTAKFPLPTGAKELLYSVSPTGKVKSLGKLANDLMLDCSGSNGELYGHLPGVSRVDP